jgi:hypothetical protein
MQRLIAVSILGLGLIGMEATSAQGWGRPDPGWDNRRDAIIAAQVLRNAQFAAAESYGYSDRERRRF